MRGRLSVKIETRDTHKAYGLSNFSLSLTLRESIG